MPAAKPDVEWTIDTLHEYLIAQIRNLRELLDERDRLYKERNDSQRTAVDAALTAVKENTKSSFDASEKAIVKAEDAQREYNIRSNEFRGQLDDQAKTLMPRPEALTMFKSVEEKLQVYKSDFDVRVERVMHEIQVLREMQSSREGMRSVADPQVNELRAEVQRLTAANNTRTGFDAGKVAAIASATALLGGGGMLAIVKLLGH